MYEHPHGVTVGEAIEAAGGVRAGASLEAILLGGAAGGFLGPGPAGRPIDLRGRSGRRVHARLGRDHGLRQGTDVVDLCLRIARFFRDESCGQCVPCRVGTVRQEEALHRLVTGRTIGAPADEHALLRDVAEVMRDASICGLGQTAANAVQSAIDTFALFGASG